MREGGGDEIKRAPRMANDDEGGLGRTAAQEMKMETRGGGVNRNTNEGREGIHVRGRRVDMEGLMGETGNERIKESGEGR